MGNETRRAQPRTTQERRANGTRSSFIDVDGYKIKARAKRGVRNLPCTWDDLVRRDADDRTWKRHRRKQYKTRGKMVDPVDVSVMQENRGGEDNWNATFAIQT